MIPSRLEDRAVVQHSGRPFVNIEAVVVDFAFRFVEESCCGKGGSVIKNYVAVHAGDPKAVIEDN